MKARFAIVLSVVLLILVSGAAPSGKSGQPSEKLDVYPQVPATVDAIIAEPEPPPARLPCTADRHGYCEDPVVMADLSALGPHPRIRLNCTLGTVLSIELPEGMALQKPPVLGNGALFQYKLQQEPLTVLLWATLPKGANATSDDLRGEVTNLQLRLDSGATVLVELRFGDHPVERLVLEDAVFSARMTEKKRLREEVRAELNRELSRERGAIQEKARQMSLRLMAHDLLQRVHCRGLRKRAMQDLLVVWAHRICQLGDHLYLELSIQNRARDLFVLEDLSVLGLGASEDKPLHSLVVWDRPNPIQLRFDQRVRGMAVVPLSAETTSAEYGLKVTESAGKERVVVLGGIEF